MNLFNGLFCATTINFLNVSVVGAAIVFGIALLAVILMLTVRCQIIFIDPEDDIEIGYKKLPWLAKVELKPASKEGKEFKGWSTDPEGRFIVAETEFALKCTTQLYAVWADPQPVEEIKEEILEGVLVKFNYMSADGEELLDSEIIKINTLLPEEQDVPVDVKGWSFEKQGEIVLCKEDVQAVFTINLYPVFSEEAVDTSNELDTSAVIELLFTDSDSDKFIYKESHYVTLNTPADYDDDMNFLGWAVEQNGEAIIERAEVDSVFTIQLYSVDTVENEVPAIEEAVEEPIVEEVVEEPVVEEAPVDTYEFVEVIEEPIVEEVVEEPVIEEPVAEEPVAEPIVEEPVVEVVEEPVIEAPVVEEPVEIEPTIVPTYIDNEGNTLNIKYSRSVTANIIQADDTVKDYYSQLKNHILSYKGVKSRISWKFDSYNRGRDQLFKIKFRGKTICLYCAIDPSELDESKYHQEPIDAKIFEDVPTLLKIKSGLGLRKAKEVVDLVMAKFEIEKDEKAKVVDYVAKYPYEENEPLLARKLIKALLADGDVVVVSNKPKEEIVEEPVIEAPIVEEVVEEPVIEEPVVEEVIEEPVVEELIAEEPVVEEPVIEEPVIEIIEVDEQGIETADIHEPVYVESVSAEEAHEILEEKHVEVHVDEAVDYITKNDTRKCIINIDTLSSAFEHGQIVDMASLKTKKLIDKKAKFVKVLARGTLDKALVIKAGDFSKTALEMIVLTGGKPIHVVYKIK